LSLNFETLNKMRGMRLLTLLVFLTGFAKAAHCQWAIQESNTVADLRGIHSVGGGVGWASGTSGVVLRTEDGGHLWRLCAIPPGAEHLDFRGVQAFDAHTAIVMSSGPGDLSRLYKTADGCRTWKLIFSNPYAPDGFFDAILFLDPQHGLLFGDPSPLNMKAPVESADDFRLRVTADGGITWGPVSAPDRPNQRTHQGDGLHTVGDESAFAASNSIIASYQGWFWFATSSARVAYRRLYETAAPPPLLFRPMNCGGAIDPVSNECGQPWTDFRNAQAPLDHSAPSAGIFSIGFRSADQGVVVGGDYKKPDNSSGTAAFTADGGQHWSAAQTSPHGYRSSVGYDAPAQTWIAVGPNGTDISTDDGRNWRPVRPNPSLKEPPDADRDWNAISLPFVVGPHGRIGKLRSDGSVARPGADPAMATRK
jgi:photosystem II stability/assembly factor-like uncharacterized protein